jgi:predicted DNA-binding ribbon-helix-helix protein
MARPRGNRKEARTSVSFDAGEYAQLCSLAARRDVSVAWLIRQAVHDLIRQDRDAVENPELPLVKRHSPQRGRGMTP